MQKMFDDLSLLFFTANNESLWYISECCLFHNFAFEVLIRVKKNCITRP